MTIARSVALGVARGVASAVTRGQSSASSSQLLLDTYTGAVAAFSLRKLSSSYAGSCVRIRRSSDNTEQDIGFSGSAFDTSAFSSFIGGGNGFVTTFYDQSGNSRNLTQTTTTTQPQLLLNQQNGLPMLSFSTHMLSRTPYQANSITAFWVVSLTTTAAVRVLSQLGYYDLALVGTDLQLSDSGVKAVTSYAQSTFATSLLSTSASFSGPNVTGVLRRNGSQQSTATVSRASTTTGLSLGNSAINFPWNGLVGEFLLFDTARADIAAIESAVNSAWSVY